MVGNECREDGIRDGRFPPGTHWSRFSSFLLQRQPVLPLALPIGSLSRTTAIVHATCLRRAFVRTLSLGPLVVPSRCCCGGSCNVRSLADAPALLLSANGHQRRSLSAIAVLSISYSPVYQEALGTAVEIGGRIPVCPYAPLDPLPTPALTMLLLFATSAPSSRFSSSTAVTIARAISKN